MTKPSTAFMFPCDLCGSTFQMGPHIYDGKVLGHYKMSLCRPCYEGNWDGIGPVHEAQFERHLAKREIPLPLRNAKGWYPR
jgi:hypothetical protein